MSLIQTLTDQMKAAMKAGDAQKRDAVRLVLNALKTEEKEKRITLTPEQEIEILTREAKKRREAIDGYMQLGDDGKERAAKEQYELDLIQSFLPAGLTQDDVKAMIAQLVTELEIKSKKDVGKLMKALMPKIKGRFDGGLAKKLVDEIELDG